MNKGFNKKKYWSYSDEIQYYARREGYAEAKLKIAINLLDILDDKTIALKTGFSEDEIKKLRKNYYEGIEEGKEEKAIEIATNLLDVLDDKTIALSTGVSEDEIKDLRIKYGT